MTCKDLRGNLGIQKDNCLVGNYLISIINLWVVLLRYVPESWRPKIPRWSPTVPVNLSLVNRRDSGPRHHWYWKIGAFRSSYFLTPAAEGHGLWPGWMRPDVSRERSPHWGVKWVPRALPVGLHKIIARLYPQDHTLSIQTCKIYGLTFRITETIIDIKEQVVYLCEIIFFRKTGRWNPPSNGYFISKLSLSIVSIGGVF